MRARLILLVLTFAATGCFELVPVGPGGSGGRLQVLGWMASDGEPVATEVFDPQHGTPCRFQPTPTGETRCMPALTVVGQFADPGCTQPVVNADLFCGGEGLVSVYLDAPSGTCGGVREPVGVGAFRVGSRTSGPVYGFDVEDGACAPLGFEREGFRLERVPDEQFVRGTAEPGARPEGERIGTWYWRSDGGAILPGGFWDFERDEACFPIASGASEHPCVPGAWSEAVLGGPSCDRPYGYMRGGACGERESEYFVLRRTSAGLCETESVEVFRGTDPTEPVGLSRCIGFTPEGRYVDAVPATDLGAVPATLDAGGRLRLASGSELLGSTNRVFRDTELDLECMPRLLAEDRGRCLPLAVRAPAPTRFTDPDCSEPAHVVSAGFECFVLMAEYPDDACSGEPPGPYYRVGAVAETVFERDASGACGPASLTDGEVARALEVLSLERFAETTRVEL